MVAIAKTAVSLVLCLVIISLVQQSHARLTAAAAAAAVPAKLGKVDKTVSFTLYQQETVNRTAYVIAEGVDDASPVVGARHLRADGAEARSFGTIYVFHDNLTVRADSSSRVAGATEGSAITTGFDGQRNLVMAKMTINHDGYRGSVSVLGGMHNTKPSVYPVVGGTGDFAYVVGYVRSSPVHARGSTVTYRLRIEVYWPPYAHYAPTP